MKATERQRHEKDHTRMRNRRRMRVAQLLSEHKGEKHSKNEWAQILKIPEGYVVNIFYLARQLNYADWMESGMHSIKVF